MKESFFFFFFFFFFLFFFPQKLERRLDHLIGFLCENTHTLRGREYKIKKRKKVENGILYRWRWEWVGKKFHFLFVGCIF